LVATTYGTGELILDAIVNRHCKKVTVLIGGSATNDGGVGLLEALGFRFFDDKNKEIVEKGGQVLERIDRVDFSDVIPEIKRILFEKEKLKEKNVVSEKCSCSDETDADLFDRAPVSFTVACDVSAVFTGPSGASRVFAPQKGATPAMVSRLEEGMAHFSSLVARVLGVDLNAVEGSGAAGGVGGCLHAFLGAALVPGVELVLDTVRFEEAVGAGCDLVITGEGRLDAQTFMGKVPVGVLKRARKRNVPVIALAGMVDLKVGRFDVNEKKDVDCLRAPLGADDFLAILPVVNGPITLEMAMNESIVRDNIFRTLIQVLKVIRWFGSIK
jgi:glycerate kinase